MPEAVRGVVVHHSNGLHEGIDDRRPNERKPAFFQCFAQCLGLLCFGRDLFYGSEAVLDRATVRTLPDKFIEVFAFFSHREKRFCIPDGRFDLLTIANNSFVVQEPLDVPLAESRHDHRIEIPKCFQVAFFLSKNSDPTQSCLRTVQNELGKELPIVMFRNTPFRIVIVRQERLLFQGGPGTANLWGHYAVTSSLSFATRASTFFFASPKSMRVFSL